MTKLLYPAFVIFATANMLFAIIGFFPVAFWYGPLYFLGSTEISSTEKSMVIIYLISFVLAWLFSKLDKRNNNAIV